MPHALPPAAVEQALPSNYALPAGMIERERQVWVVDALPKRHERAPCPEAKGDEIVVCAAREDDPARDRIGKPLPDPPTAMEEMSRKMHVKIGPADVHPTSFRDAAGGPTVGVSMTIKF